jgi:hypothetical protein
MTPVSFILAFTYWIGLAILLIGKRRIPELHFIEEKGTNLPPH